MILKVKKNPNYKDYTYVSTTPLIRVPFINRVNFKVFINELVIIRHHFYFLEIKLKVFGPLVCFIIKDRVNFNLLLLVPSFLERQVFNIGRILQKFG